MVGFLAIHRDYDTCYIIQIFKATGEAISACTCPYEPHIGSKITPSIREKNLPELDNSCGEIRTSLLYQKYFGTVMGFQKEGKEVFKNLVKELVEDVVILAIGLLMSSFYLGP